MADFGNNPILDTDTSTDISGAGDTLHTYTTVAAGDIDFVVQVNGLTGNSYIVLRPEVDGFQSPPTVLTADTAKMGFQLVAPMAAQSGKIVKLYVSSPDATANNVTLTSYLRDGRPQVNAAQINRVSAASVTAVNAHQGTTEVVNFTGTGATAYVKAGLWDILGTALTETAGYLTAAFKQFFNVATPTGTVNEITTIKTNVGTPANIDSGGATLADNLKKLADDNGGLTFDATNDSLNKGHADLAIVKGLLGSNMVLDDFTWSGSLRTGCNIYLYDTQAHAAAHVLGGGAATGCIGIYAWAATHSGLKPTLILQTDETP